MKEKRTPEADLETIIPILIGVWRRYRKEAGPPDKLQTREFRSVVENIKILLQGSDKGESLIGKDYFSRPELLSAYLLYQWVIHYQEGMSLIGEIPITPKRVLDVCSGPAPYALAALRHGAREVIAVDRNATALALGGEVCGRYGYPLSVRRWDCLKQSLPVEGKFDLIILGHCLQELFPDGGKAQQDFVRMLLGRLTPQGYLLVVDNSFNEMNQRILTLRDTLVGQGIAVQAPCVWKGECPALKSGSPCYAQREFDKPYLIKELQRAADIKLGSLKMTYIIFRSPEAGWPDVGDKQLYRVISPPVEGHTGKRYYLCGVDGKKNMGSRLEILPKEARAFDYLRRGELIAVNDALQSPNSLDIIQGTSVTVEAACGKPLSGEDEDV